MENSNELNQMTRLSFLAHTGLAAASLAVPSVLAASKPSRRWWKGNLHMHSQLSDGEGFPQEMALLYEKFGYNFVCFTDHNRTHIHADKLSNEATAKRFFRQNVARFEKHFPGHLPKPEKDAQGRVSYRLPTFEQMSKSLNKPDRFLLMCGCEWHNNAAMQLHCNVTNTFVEQKPEKVRGVSDSMEKLLARYGSEIGFDNEKAIFTANHPICWFYDLDPMELVAHPEVRFFEIANCDSEPTVKPPEGMWTLDKFWDIVLAHRLEKGLPAIYGVATDDTHWCTPFYKEMAGGPHVTRGYVRIMSDRLEPNALVRALRCGEFHASTGLDLKAVRFDAKTRTLSVEADVKPGTECVIRFVGTKRGFDKTRTKVGPFTVNGLAKEQGVKPLEGYLARMPRTVEAYSKDVGRTLKEVTGTRAEYRMAPDDLYVRAKVFIKAAPGVEDEPIPKTPTAWTQPFEPTSADTELVG